MYYADDLQKRARGPYRRKHKVPRQTRFNRRKKLSVHSTRTGMQSHILLSPIQSVSGLLVTPTVESAEIISQAPSDSEAETDTANILDPPCNEEHIDSDLPATHSSISIPDANQPDSLDSRCSSGSITDPTSIKNAGNCNDQMLYSGSLTTVQTSCIAINSFFHKHHLSKQAQVDLLRLQQQLLPIPNRLPNSLYHFRRVVDLRMILRNYTITSPDVILLPVVKQAHAAMHYAERKWGTTTLLCYQFAHN